MGNYNFEDKSKEFGETVRIDTINEEVRKREERKPSSEPEYIRNENKDYRQHRPKGRDVDEDGFGGSGIVRLSIIGGIIVFVFIFAVVFLSQSGWISGTKTGNTQTNDTDISQGLDENEGVYAIILNADNNRTVRFYSINDKKHLSLTVDSETILTGANGGSMDYSGLKTGDVVVVTQRDNTGNAGRIFVPEDIWRKENITEVQVDTATNTVEYGDTIYNYGDDTFFVDNGNSVYPGDISQTDTVTLIGKNNMLFVARLEKTHGHLVFKNLDKVENAVIKVDGEEVEADKDRGIVEVAEGEHKIVVSGTNIEDYEIDLVIIPNDKTVIDINENDITQKANAGLIKLNVSPNGYTVLLDGVPYLQSTTEVYAEKGTHKIEIVKPGYETGAVEITLADKTIEVNIKLEKFKTPEKKAEVSEGNVSVYSNPGWAKVYIDGEYIGIAPVMAKLSYGEHYISAELDGYDEFKTHITVDSPDKAITAKFE
ncbi:MAG: PEGA domain-containing protein [Anaerotignaceae bacterium]